MAGLGEDENESAQNPRTYFAGRFQAPAGLHASISAKHERPNVKTGP